MITAFFDAVFYNPLYNALVGLVALVPAGDVGVAVILLTIVIRLILLPFSLAAARTQRAMKNLTPRLKELKEKHKGDKEKEALETLALYKDAKVNPFAGILIIFVQIPVLLALYWVFFNEPFPTLNLERLYDFTPTPAAISLLFLGLLPIAGKSLVLAFIAGLTQYYQARIALKVTMNPENGAMQGEFQRIMGLQLKYVFPVLIAVISYTTSTALALYFITSNIAGIVQEWHVHRKVYSQKTA